MNSVTVPHISAGSLIVPNKLMYAVTTFNSKMAKDWLAFNKNNRPVNRIAIERYKRDMEEGSWQFAGDPIRVDNTGRIIDGQHRLIALSEITSDIEIEFLLISGLEPESQMVMDQGVKRTTGQQLSILGVKNYNHVAAAAKFYLVWSSGVLFRDNKVQSRVTTPQIQEWVMDNADFYELENELHTQIAEVEASPSVVTAAIYKFNLIDEEAARTFLELLVTGAGLASDSPILALDKRLRRVRREKIKLSNRDILALFIQAWNAWRDEKAMTKFQKPRGGFWTEDTFPVVADTVEMDTDKI